MGRATAVVLARKDDRLASAQSAPSKKTVVPRTKHRSCGEEIPVRREENRVPRSEDLRSPSANAIFRPDVSSPAPASTIRPWKNVGHPEENCVRRPKTVGRREENVGPRSKNRLLPGKTVVFISAKEHFSFQGRRPSNEERRPVLRERRPPEGSRDFSREGLERASRRGDFPFPAAR
jgi:hypothetical protein